MSSGIGTGIILLLPHDIETRGKWGEARSLNLETAVLRPAALSRLTMVLLGIP